jgi:hypothetical protein
MAQTAHRSFSATRSIRWCKRERWIVRHPEFDGWEGRAGVPSGAGTLCLGISDAGFDNGTPGAYGDNAEFYTVNFNVTGGTTSAPEPSSLMLIGTGFLGLLSLRRKVIGR